MTAPNEGLRLALVGVGTRVRLLELRGSPGLSHRLAELGLVPGVELEVVQDGGGNLLLAVGDTRLALGRGVAHSLIVTPLG